MTKGQFVYDVTHWNSYLPLLWLALENTNGKVIELGVGDGSTKRLHEYCNIKQRLLYSYESDIDYYRKFEQYMTDKHTIEYVGNNWEPLIEQHRSNVGVLFSDEAPGEMRKYNISMFCNIAQVIVAHDAEPENGGYKYSLVEPLFKYHVLHEFPGASTAAFSNFVDVTKWSF